MTTYLPVNPEVLVWAREERGLSIEEAAEILEFNIDDLIAYESGDKIPSITRVRTMAHKYQFPDATLMMPEPLPHLPKPRDFRTKEGVRGKLSVETLAAIDQARFYLSEISDVLEYNPDLYSVPSLLAASPEDDVEDIAARERERIGVSPTDQLRWKDYDEAFNRWRYALESHGIFIYLMKMPVEDCRGITIFDEPEPRLPAIIVNDRDYSIQTKIFTIWHEYAHLLLRQPGISDQNFSNNVEWYCNRFSSSFLMPDECLKAIGIDPTASQEDWEYKDIANLSRQLKVSQTSLAIRLESKNLAPDGFAKRWMSQWKTEVFREQEPDPIEAKEKSKIIIPYAIRKFRELGSAHTGVVFDAIRDGTIESQDAVEMLGAGERHLDALRAILERRRDKYE